MRGGRRPGHRIGHIAAVLRLDPPPHPVAWFAPEDRRRAEALLGDNRPLLVLGPTANWDGKVWPAGRFVALAHALLGPGGACGVEQGGKELATRLEDEGYDRFLAPAAV